MGFTARLLLHGLWFQMTSTARDDSAHYIIFWLYFVKQKGEEMHGPSLYTCHVYLPAVFSTFYKTRLDFFTFTVDMNACDES